MSLFHDDRFLVQELIADKARLIEENQKLKDQVASLVASLAKLSEGLEQQPQPQARMPKIPIPDYYRDQIAWEKVGMETPRPEQMLRASEVKKR